MIPSRGQEMEKSGFGSLWYVSPWNAMDEAVPKRRIVIDDTTLRDGEHQARGVFDNAQKIDIAAALDAMAVDRIEAGMVTSSEEAERIGTIVARRKRAEILAIVRARPKDAMIAVSSGVNGVGVILFSNEQYRRIFGWTSEARSSRLKLSARRD